VQIRVVQSGGFAALRVERAVETERLPETDRDEFERLVLAANFFELPERAVSRLPDVVVYRVRVATRDRSHEVTTDEQTAPATLFALVVRVLAIEA
jgi:AmiR/NasT family two-component response regulator